MTEQPEFAITVTHEVTDYINVIKCDDGGMYVQMGSAELKLNAEQTGALVRQLVEWYGMPMLAHEMVEAAVQRARDAATVTDPSRLFRKVHH